MGDILYILISRIFNLRPRLYRTQDALVAVTSTRFAILTFGLKLRKVMIDSHQQAIRIFSRSCWFFTRVRRVPFDRVKEVLYEYHDVSPGSGIAGVSYTETDLFVVSVRLKDRKIVLLAKFFGRGSFVNNSIMPDWLYFVENVRAGLSSGDQEEESRAFASSVAAIIGVDIVNQ